MNQAPTLLVLAAGMGSRYGGLKQLDAMGPSGETIMDYSVYDARRAGFEKIVFVIRRDIEDAFRETIGSRYDNDVEVAYAYQQLDTLPAGFQPPEGRTKPWGTGHAIWVARDVVDTPFAVINADDFYGADAYRTAADYLRCARDGAQADYCMVGYTLRNTLSQHGAVSRGICQCDAASDLADVVETLGIEPDGQAARFPDPQHPDQWNALTGDEIVSMNLWGFTPSIFDHLERLLCGFLSERGGEEKSEFYIPFAVNDLIQSRQARVRVLSSSASWFGVTYREDREHARESIGALVDAGVYPPNLRSAPAPISR